MDLKIITFFSLHRFLKRLLFRLYLQRAFFLLLKMDEHWCFPKFYLTLALVTTICKNSQGIKNHDMYFECILNGSDKTHYSYKETKLQFTEFKIRNVNILFKVISLYDIDIVLTVKANPFGLYIFK